MNKVWKKPVLLVALFTPVAIAGRAQRPEDRARIDYEVAKLALQEGNHRVALEKLEAVGKVLGRGPELLVLIAQSALALDQVDKAAAAVAEAFAHSKVTNTPAHQELIQLAAKIELRKSGVQTEESKAAARRKLLDSGYMMTEEGFFRHVEAGNVHAVRTYLLAGFSPNQLFKSTTVESGGSSAYRWETTCNWSKSPLFLAAENGHAGVVRALLEFKADPLLEGECAWRSEATSGASSGRYALIPIHAAIQSANIQILEDMINSRVKIPLNGFAIALSGKRVTIELFNFLHSHGADVNFKDNNTIPPIWSLCARFNDWPEGLETLLKIGATPRTSNFDGYSPLMYCQEKPGFARLLIDAGIDIKHKKDGRTAYEMAKSNYKLWKQVKNTSKADKAREVMALIEAAERER